MTSTPLRIPALAIAIALPCLATGCAPGEGVGAGAEPAQAQRITITGSSTVAPLMNEIGKRFELRHPDVRVDVQTGGSSRGIADAREGLTDIGMVSRNLSADEADLHAVAIARDGVCLIVHGGNPVAALSDEEVVGIYTGRIGNWSEVGGANAEITVINKAQGRSTLELFASHFGIDPKAIQADIVIGDNEQGIKTVAGNLNSIGYVSIGAAQYSREQGVPLKVLPVDGVEASTERVADGTFPLSRPLHLVTNSSPEGTVRELIDFARSAEVHDLVEEMSFVPLR